MARALAGREATRYGSAVRLAVYALTILGSAFLLFAVQPMAGKALLPQLGGVPGAWTACLLFFQAALLVGYGYVWLGARVLPVRARVLAHLALVALPLLVLAPFGALGGVDAFDPARQPAAYALAYLALNVGLPFTVLSATAPLLQSWFARASDRRPYFLYAASNAGSLGALLAYPFVAEPWLDLGAQASAFRVGYALALGGIALAGAFVWKAGGPRQAPVPGDAPRPAVRRRLTWVGLALVPTLLLAGATAYLSMDLAPIPLLWVVPLALYLLSFVLAFSERVAAPAPVVERGMCLVGVLLVFFTLLHQNEPVWLLALLHLGFLFVASWVAHRRLADDAPHPAHLPEFFAWIALGGVLGTLIAAVVAPAILPDLWEYPVAIALACLPRRRVGVVVPDRPWKKDLPHVAATFALVALPPFVVPRLELEPPQLAALVSLGPGALYAYRWMPLRRRYTLCLLAIVVAGAWTGGRIQEEGERLETTRSFFGVLRVVDQAEQRVLLHGTTLHGTQRHAERDGCAPTSYYARSGPLGSLFAARTSVHSSVEEADARVVAVGLGTGAVACYARPGEAWRFVEINPDVIDVARAHFTYLENAGTDDLTLTLGDGRRVVEAERDASLILVDAFNSDSVPVHLLTREALRVYVDALAPEGWVALHLSNRVLDLNRVVADAAAAEGLAVRIAQEDRATWAVLARDEEDLAPLDPARWRPLTGGEPARAWTDAFSSLWSAVRTGR